jgi:hypothetical protein
VLGVAAANRSPTSGTDMPINREQLLSWPFQDIEHTYTPRDTILYALGVGLGADPVDTQQLRFLYEAELQALPTMAVILSYPGFWLKDPKTGADWKKILHGEQNIRRHRPLPDRSGKPQNLIPMRPDVPDIDGASDEGGERGMRMTRIDDEELRVL